MHRALTTQMWGSIPVKWSGATKSQVGYFAQDHRGTIQRHNAWRNGCTRSIRRHPVRRSAGLLGQMLFRGEEGQKPRMRCREAKRQG